MLQAMMDIRALTPPLPSQELEKGTTHTQGGKTAYTKGQDLAFVRLPTTKPTTAPKIAQGAQSPT